MDGAVNSVVVVGLQWGDEGKGKIVDLLSVRADVVVRFQGGNNAGHTLVVDGEQTVLHLVPSGALHDSTVCVIGGGVVVDPTVLVEELLSLRRNGRLTEPGSLMVSQEAHVILPYHKAIDVAREGARERARGQGQGTGKIGTTGRGIGPAYEDKYARTGVRMADFVDGDAFRELLRVNLEEKNAYLEAMHGEVALDYDDIVEGLSESARELAPYVADTSAFIDAAIRGGRRVLFEGAQGLLLDVDHGSYPFVTSSNTGAAAVAAGAGVAPKLVERVVGISKAYTTRVGSGPFPTQLDDHVGDYLRKEGGEFGATTGRPRRCGWLDAVVLRKTVRLNGVDTIALTKLDVLSGLETLSICTGYMLDGRLIDYVPSRSADFERVEPVYEDYPGWTEDITAIASMDELPETARAYVRRIEELLAVPVGILSTGPARDQTLILSEPFG